MCYVRLCVCKERGVSKWTLLAMDVTFASMLSQYVLNELAVHLSHMGTETTPVHFLFDMHMHMSNECSLIRKCTGAFVATILVITAVTDGSRQAVTLLLSSLWSCVCV